MLLIYINYLMNEIMTTINESESENEIKNINDPKIGQLVIVCIESIDSKAKTMTCKLLEYVEYKGIVARVEGNRKTHKAYKHLKVKDISVFVCNEVDIKTKTIILSYSAIDEEILNKKKSDYLKLEKIKLIMLKIAANKNNIQYDDIDILFNNNNLIQLRDKYFNEIYNNNIIEDFYDLTNNMYEKSKSWSFYDKNVDMLLHKEFKLPQYIAYIDFTLTSYNCDAVKHHNDMITNIITMIYTKLCVPSDILQNNILNFDGKTMLTGNIIRLQFNSSNLISEDIMVMISNEIINMKNINLDIGINNIVIERKK